MKKNFLALLAMTLVAGAGLTATASAIDVTGYDNDMYAAQTAHDAFNFSVKQRLQIARFPSGAYGGRMALAPLQSESAFAATPSSRDGYTSRRMIDCGPSYGMGGFTIWGDGYGAWSKQRTNDNLSGYKYQVAGPALGIDWSNGAFTAGVAATYSWGKIRGVDISNERNTRTFGVIGYGQWTNQQLYVNGTIGYGYNRYGSNSRWSTIDSFGNFNPNGLYNTSSSYNSNSWDLAAEVGYKFRFANFFTVTPNVGLRYFHDNRDDFVETGSWASALSVSDRNYHVLELPVGVDLGYEITTSGAILIPHVGFTWTPELDRKRGEASGFWRDNGWAWSETSPRRGRNGYTIAAGLQARFNQNITAHLDYNCELRDRKYEHRLNLGVGFTF